MLKKSELEESNDLLNSFDNKIWGIVNSNGFQFVSCLTFSRFLFA